MTNLSKDLLHFESKTLAFGLSTGTSPFTWYSQKVKCSGIVHSVVPLANQSVLRHGATVSIDTMDSHYIWGIATASFELIVHVGYFINT